MIKTVRESSISRGSGCFCARGNCFEGLEGLVEWGFWVISNGVFMHGIAVETRKA